MATHIGSMIQSVLRQKNISTPHFAKLLGKHPQGAARIFRRADLHCTLLKQISAVVGYDFFQYYTAASPDVLQKNQTQITDLQQKLTASQQLISTQQKDIEQLKKENDYLKQINQLLTGKK